MQEKIIKFVEDLKNRRSSLDSLDEASTRQAVIGKLLHLLGWDIFNVDEVIPEYPVGDTRIDYALRTGKYNDKAFIEVKRIREDLERHQKQLLEYCFKEGVGFAVLTNGIVWWFYLPLRPTSWEERRFYAIDIVQQDSRDIASKFIEFLSRDNVVNGNSAKSADTMYVGRNKASILEDALPKAWDKMIAEGNNKLIELIGDVTENMCGTRPNTETIKRFLSDHEYHIKSVGIAIESNGKTAKNADVPNVSIANIKENKEVSPEKGGVKKKRYGKYAQAISDHIGWIKERITNSQDGIVTIKIRELAKKMGPEFEKKDVTSVYWALKYILFYEGFVVDMGTQEEGEKVLKIRIRKSEDKLPPSLEKLDNKEDVS